MNGERWIMWNGIPLSTTWRWPPVNDREIGRELLRGARLDQILVTNDPVYRSSGPTGEARR